MTENPPGRVLPVDEAMEADPHLLDDIGFTDIGFTDIGFTLEEFADRQWQGHKRNGALHRHWQRLGSSPGANALRDTLRFHRTPLLKS